LWDFGVITPPAASKNEITATKQWFPAGGQTGAFNH
jgi:hypothetical protein